MYEEQKPWSPATIIKLFNVIYTYNHLTNANPHNKVMSICYKQKLYPSPTNRTILFCKSYNLLRVLYFTDLHPTSLELYLSSLIDVGQQWLKKNFLLYQSCTLWWILWILEHKYSSLCFEQHKQWIQKANSQAIF